MTDQTTDTPEATESTDSTAVPVDNPAGPQAEEVADMQADEAPTEAKTPRPRLSITFGLRSLVIAAVIAALIGAVGTLAWLYIDARGELNAQASEAADNARAEKISLDYAVNAATMDFKDLQAWKVQLVAGTSQELNDKLSEAAQSMEQILVPLEWSSTAEPLVAKVRSRNEGTIVVDCFVSVQTKTVQAPEALQSTATYSITIDTNDSWLITDVGGIGSAVGQR